MKYIESILLYVQCSFTLKNKSKRLFTNDWNINIVVFMKCFSSLFMICSEKHSSACYAFQIQSQTSDQPKKMSYVFYLRFIFVCHLVLYQYVCAVKNPEISGFCVFKIKVVPPTDHKRVKKIKTQCSSVTQTKQFLSIV